MFKVNLAAFYEACGVTPPNSENTADAAGTVVIKDGTDFANLCRRSGVPPEKPVTLTFPDVCFLPSPPAGPIPIPYPNVALDNLNNELGKGGFKKVKVADAGKTSRFTHSAGDEAGPSRGVVNSRLKDKAEFVNYSFDVKAEGKPVVRMTSFR